MSNAVAKCKRVVVISDLHLGGTKPVMMSRPERLVRFLRDLPQKVLTNEQLELVIAGDFVDFLAVEPWASWTPDPSQAQQKLCDTMESRLFAPVFDALRDLVAKGSLLTILLGNHDLELALPRVQEALRHRLAAWPHQVSVLADGRAYRIGGLLIEHGNRYDGANGNDWEYLRGLASAQSRAEEFRPPLRVSAGSQFVQDHVNHLKRDYPFLDLLQPQNELVALLMLAFEPDLAWDWSGIAASLSVQRLQAKNAEGAQPGKTYQIAATPLDKPDEELRAAFGQKYEELRYPSQTIGVVNIVQAYLQNRKESLAEILRHGGKVPASRLHQTRLLLRRALLSDSSSEWTGPTEQYGKAAKRLLAEGDKVQVVIMGHTHLPRKVSMEGGLYINTGTWIDRIRVPDEALRDGADVALQAFLKALLEDTRPDDCPPTYAEARISSDGSVEEIELKEAEK